MGRHERGTWTHAAWSEGTFLKVEAVCSSFPSITQLPKEFPLLKPFLFS